MKVYIVYEYDGEFDHVRRVFSSEEKANEYIQHHGGTGFSVEEFDVDEPFEKTESFWEVEMYLQKKPCKFLIKCELDIRKGRYADSIKFCEGSSSRIVLIVKARTYNEAVEESYLRLVKIIDEKEGLYKKVFISEATDNVFDKYRRVNYLTGEYM